MTSKIRFRCSGCGQKRTLHPLLCRACKRTTTTEPATPVVALPTIDVVTGSDPRDNGHVSRERIVRVSLVEGGLLRLMTGIRLDATTVHVTGSVIVPVRSLPAVIQALKQLAS